MESNYSLKGAPPDLWKAVKARAAKEGRTIKFIIVTLLARYVKEGL